MNKCLIIIIFLFLNLLSVFGQTPILFELQTQTLEVVKNAFATIQGENESWLTVPSEYGGGFIRWVVADGTFVKKGDLLVILDTEGLEVEKNEAENNLEIQLTEMDVIARKNALAVERQEIKIRDQEALIAYNQELRALLFAPPPEERVAIEKSAIRAASVAIQFHTAKLGSQKKLLERGFLSPIDFSRQANEKEKAETQNELAEVNLSLLLNPENRLERDKATREMEKSRLDLDLFVGELENIRQSGELKTQKEGFSREKWEKKVQKAQGRLQRTRLQSPADGIVLYPEGGFFKIAAGSQVWPSFRLLRVTSPRNIFFNCQVPEGWVDQIATSTMVKVILPGAPDSPLPAMIKSIGKLGKPFNSKNPLSPKFYEVRVSPLVSLADKFFRLGMTSQVFFTLFRGEGVIEVPVDYMVPGTEGEVPTLLLADGSRFKITPAPVFRNQDYWYFKSEDMRAIEKIRFPF